jgi:hypothetical protein
MPSGNPAIEQNFELILGKFNLDEEVADAAKAVRDARLLLAQPVVVGDAHVVHLLQELGVLASDLRTKMKKMLRTHF